MAKRNFVVNINIPDMCGKRVISLYLIDILLVISMYYVCVFKIFFEKTRRNKLIDWILCYFLARTSVQQQQLDTTTHVQLSGPSDVADVMVLFEETDKIKKTLSDLLSTFVDQITINFNRKGIK